MKTYAYPCSKRLAARAAAGALMASLLSTATTAYATELYVDASRATLVKAPTEMGEVAVADPAVADVRAHGTMYLSVIGKHPGQTTIRIFDKDRTLLQSYDVHVGYDLVAIRKALKDFMPEEMIGVEMINRNLALTGQISSALAADKAIRIARQFVDTESSSGGGASTGGAARGASAAAASGGGSGGAGGSVSNGPQDILNLMQVTSGQQVMLRVRVGEIQRSALKRFGIDPAAAFNSGGFFIHGGLGTTMLGRLALNNSALTTDYTIPDSQFQGAAALGYSRGNDTGMAVLKALEEDGLFKLLAEPNLVAISGEQAEFLAGGEIPIPVPQAGGGGGNTTVTIEYKPFGVGVKFRPFVLNENRIRMDVQPEVSELNPADGVRISGFIVPAISTRRAKTTVELAPGESFMIAGLIKDEAQSTIDQLPGVKELPILGALFRSTEFKRNETELVIAVTPYIVDPMKSKDVRLPTDNFAPASQMEMIFYGALGSLGGNASRVSQAPTVEGPVGFITD